MAEHARTIELYAYQLGELPAPRRAAVDQHLGGCETCRARLTELEQEDSAFRREANAAAASVQILARLEAGEGQGGGVLRWRWLGALLPVAALGLMFSMKTLGPDDASVRTKGAGPAIEMFLNTPHGPEAVKAEQALHARDQIQFRYHAAGLPFVVVLESDGAGLLTELFPGTGGESFAVEPEGSHVLPGSIILDDAVGPERIFAVFSKLPLLGKDVAEAVRRAINAAGSARKVEGPLPGLDDAVVVVFDFTKV
ncbi:MAG: zf-HC2 domain-containing protein [Myxococcota bacterium]